MRISLSKNQTIIRGISFLATGILMGAIAWLFIIKCLFSYSPVVISLQAATVALMLWARITFGWRSFHVDAKPTEGLLITRGPYRFIRHPVYTAIWLFTWAGISAHISILTISLGLVITLALAVRIICEEHFLRAYFPAYAGYASHTFRLIPFVF